MSALVPCLNVYLNCSYAALEKRNQDLHPKTALQTILFVHIASPQQGDLRLSGLPSRLGTSGGARTRDRRVPADLRADSLATEPPTPLPYKQRITNN
ncbi:hypothetical protein PoB_000342100 [Plakobranchus ocellatus]|uniref:Uncharacterized protein n=1 Tax=Plakobranchus ocellatus TaxID=259542 RepID=A0AAV3Y3C5_9GAST|nr:hypothetical protein PoB_000342100 [Plakobranchus ocellatus]